MTIFGFNTDVKHGDNVYHVQSEARQGELLMQTLVFVKGQCIGKRIVSYANKAAEPGFSEDEIHELIKTQHKEVVSAISTGHVDTVLGTTQEIHDTGGDAGLSLKLTKAEPNAAEASITMHFQVTDAGHVVSEAHVAVLAGSAAIRIIAEAATDAEGNAMMLVPFDDELRREAAITVRANHGDKSATRRFRLKKSE